VETILVVRVEILLAVMVETVLAVRDVKLLVVQVETLPAKKGCLTRRTGRDETGKKREILLAVLVEI
jgi:hypothetical protein